MSKTLKTLSGLCALSVGAVSLLPSPASAFIFSGGSVAISDSDAGSSFQVAFDGNVSLTPIPGLSAFATVTFLGFQTAGNFTLANLQVDLTNTSSVRSRVSAFAFNTTPNLPSNPNVVAAISGGIFPNVVLDGRLPNGFGPVEVCFNAGNTTCQGGGSGGVVAGSTGTFFPTLAFRNPVVDPSTRPPTRQPVTNFTLSNFGVRYQGVRGVAQGTSGTGQGTPVPQSVPEPGVVGALASAGFVALRYRKRREASKPSLKVANPA